MKNLKIEKFEFQLRLVPVNTPLSKGAGSVIKSVSRTPIKLSREDRGAFRKRSQDGEFPPVNEKKEN